MKKWIRKILAWGHRLVTRPIGNFDGWYLDKAVSAPNQCGHMQYLDRLVELGNHSGKRVLEIGSREVTGESKARERFSNAEYVGFDFYAGPNVDVVGDAHRLSSYFNEKFDVIYSSAVFEHLSMPWLVATEISKLLNVGGIVFVETHFSFSSHERPWHFFQFSDMALKSLFSPALGFETIDSGMSNPIVGRFSSLADHYLRYRPVKGLYCHSEFLGKKERDVHDFSWNNVDLQTAVNNTKYPAPTPTADK